MKTVTSLDLRKKIGEVIDEVRYRKEVCAVTKNGRSVVMIMDYDTWKASQENLKDEAFIEEYTQERIAEFLSEDKVDASLAARIKKSL